MNPFRFLLRITEYLAGPPIHEELSSLQEHSEKLSRRAADLEVERDELRQHAANLERELDRLRDHAANLEKQRDALRNHSASVERERDELKRRESLKNEWKKEPQHAAHREREHRELPVHLANGASTRDRFEVQPGTFVLLSQQASPSRYNRTLLNGPQNNTESVDLDFGCAQKAVYDPIADQVLFSGAPHPSNGSAANQLFRYDVATDTWTVKPVPGTWGAGYAYDTNALNPTAREMYASSKLLSNGLRRMNLETGTWSSMAQPDTIGFSPSEASAEYFPDRDELLWLQMKRLGAWKRSSNTWTLISPSLTRLGSRSAIARYNPVYHCVLILGGADTSTTPATFSHAVYKYDRNGVITRLKDSPPSIKVYISRAVVAADPTSGDFVFVQAVLGPDINDFTGQIEFWKYSIDKDTWAQLDETVVPAPAGWWAENHPFGVVATPMTRYGGIMFMSGAGSKFNAYLYNHAIQQRTAV